MNKLSNSIQIGIKYLIFKKINFPSKFRSAAPRLKLSHLGNLLTLRNFLKCIMGILASINTATSVLTETYNLPMILRELRVWRGTLSWHSKMIYLSRPQLNTWKARLLGFGIAEQHYC